MAVFTMPEYIFTGTNALWEAKETVRACGKKAFIVTGKHVAKSAAAEELKRMLEESGISYEVFDGITGEPTDTMILEGKQCYLESGCDFLIGIGGGSPLDSAKAIGLMLTHSGKISEFAGMMIEAELPPVVAIPTTAGTGSEATKFTVITDAAKDIKMLLKGNCLLPRIAIVDPAYSVSSATEITVSTALDALTHAVEAYTSQKASPLTDALAISAVKRILKYLPAAYEDGSNLTARQELAMAALEAGICINNSSVTIVHGMSRPIGALFHVPHGLSNAMLLKECLAFAMDGALERFAILGYETGNAQHEDGDPNSAQQFLEAIEALCSFCQVPTLTTYGIDREAFLSLIPKMAMDAVASGSPANTRKPVTEEDCRKLYEKLVSA